MASLSEVFNLEVNRKEPKEWNKIHLFKMGDFWRAYELGLELHMGKLHIQEVHKGVEFLGTFVKPYRDYVSSKTINRIKKKIQQIDLHNVEATNRTIGSYLGILSHTASYNLRREIFDIDDFTQILEYDADLTKSKPIAA